jgi:hypothetical protein
MDKEISSRRRRNRFTRYLHNAAQERAREQAIAPDLDALRREGVRLVFVEFPYEVARLVFIVWKSISLLFLIYLFTPFLAPFPHLLRKATYLAKEHGQAAKDGAERNELWNRRVADFRRRWTQRKEEVQNAR